MQTHAVHLLAGAYALDSLGDPELVEFEAHLATCADCRAEVAGMREAVVLMTAAVEVSPPDHVRGLVARDISRVRPLPPELAVRAAVPVRFRRLRPIALAAAAALIAVVGVGASLGLGSGGPAQASASSQVMQASDSTHSTVESDRGWGATVWRSDSLGQAVIVTHHLPPAPAGLVYQLWLDQPASGRVSAGVMSPGSDQTVVLVGDAASANGAAITLEPIGGSIHPTSDSIASFDFGQGA